jgi:hypothetical protein
VPHPSQILQRLLPRSAVSLLLIVTLMLNSWAQSTDTKPRTVTLKRGQALKMKLVKRLDSRRAKVGDDFVLKLVRPLLADGATVLPAGWAVHGRITDVKRAARNCLPGSIHWELEPLTMTDGAKIEIRSISEDAAQWSLLNQAQHDAAVTSAGGKTRDKTTRKTVSSVGFAVKGIAWAPLWAPLIILMLPFIVVAEGLSEGRGLPESCPGGKGRENSIPAGTAFYAEISDDVQRTVD